MKKVLSILLAFSLLLSLGCTAFADDEGITSAKVLNWLYEGDDDAASAEDQLANGALRLAEMMVALNNAVGVDWDDADRLEDDLAALEDVDYPDVDDDIKLATGLIKALDAFVVFEQNVDPNGNFDPYLDKILDDYNQRDAVSDTAREKAVNALYAMVRLSALLTEIHCSSQEMVDQIEEGLTEFGEDEEATETLTDQLENGSRWLCRMLGALIRVLDPNGAYGDFYAQAGDVVSTAKENADSEPGTIQEAVDWLYGCVHMAGVLTDGLAG